MCFISTSRNWEFQPKGYTLSKVQIVLPKIFFFFRVFFCTFCYSKSVTCFLHERINKSSGLLKCKYKCKYSRLFLLSIFMYVT